MLTNNIRYILGLPPSNLPELKKDFDEVLNVIWELDMPNKIKPFVCHEIARMICAGMRKKGYDARVCDGRYYEEKLGLGIADIEHSWVEINPVVLDFHFVKDFGRMVQTCHDEIVYKWWEKRRYIHNGAKYDIARGLEGIAQGVFGENYVVYS